MARVRQGEGSSDRQLQGAAGPDRIAEAHSSDDRVVQAMAGRGGTARLQEYNVLVVVLDDIGVEWFDFYDIGARYTTDTSFEYCTTPFLSSMASSGLVFDQAYVEPICGPTRWEILSGRYAHRTGTGGNQRDPTSATGALTWPVFGYGSRIRDANQVALPARLATRGIATGAFGKWHVVDAYSFITTYDATHGYPVDPPDSNLGHPCTHGFQRYRGNLMNIGGQYSYWRNSADLTDLGKVYLTSGGTPDGTMTILDQEGVGMPAPTYDETCYNSARIAADFSAWIATQTGPWFSYVAIGAPHEPFFMPPDTMTTAALRDALIPYGLNTPGSKLPGNSLYTTPGMPQLTQAMMYATDLTIRRVWESIPAAQRARTMLFVIGDNGTVGNFLPSGFSHQKRTVYWGGTQVPLLVHGPLVARPGSRVTSLVHAVDLFPTICEIMRVNPWVEGQVITVNDAGSGSSFYGLIRNTLDRNDLHAVRDHVVCHSFLPMGTTNMSAVNQSGRLRGIWDGEYRLIIRGTSDPELFLRSEDPQEDNDIAADEPDKAAELLDALNATIPDG